MNALRTLLTDRRLRTGALPWTIAFLVLVNLAARWHHAKLEMHRRTNLFIPVSKDHRAAMLR
jgi:hypothetical protein